MSKRRRQKRKSRHLFRKFFISLLVICAGTLLTYQIFHPIRFKSSPYVLSLGEDFIPEDAIWFVFPGSLEDVKMDNNVRPTVAGSYQAQYTLDGNTYTLDVLVKDGQSPDMTVQDITVGVNEEVDAESFVQNLSDASRVTLQIQNPSALVNEPGERMVEIMAIDEYGNVTIKTARITREEEQDN